MQQYAFASCFNGFLKSLRDQFRVDRQTIQRLKWFTGDYVLNRTCTVSLKSCCQDRQDDVVRQPAETPESYVAQLRNDMSRNTYSGGGAAFTN